MAWYVVLSAPLLPYLPSTKAIASRIRYTVQILQIYYHVDAGSMAKAGSG